jgi:8-oxo-dGTP diphosphatase
VQIALGAEIEGPDDRAWPLPPSHRMRCWLAVVTDGEPQPLEDHDLLRVVRLDSWAEVAWLPADVPVVRAVAARAPTMG